MQRREFIITSLLSLPAFACSPVRRLGSNPSKAFVVKAGESRFGLPTPFLGVNPNDLKLSTKDTGGKLSAFDYTGVQQTGPRLHMHLWQDEVFFVLDGEYVFQVGEEKQRLQAGDLIFLPRNIPHTWVQLSERGQMFYFLQPAGKMEEFFTKMTELGGKATPEEFKQIEAEHGIQNYGPPLSPTEKHQFAEKLSKGFVVRASQNRFGEKPYSSDLKVSAQDTSGELSIFEYQGSEKGGPPLHVHPNQDESFYIAAGEYLFQCGEEKFTLGKGDMIFLPRGVPHTFAQLTDQGRMLFFFQPSGKMEDFFRVLANPTGIPATDGGKRLFSDHDMEITGPPLEF